MSRVLTESQVQANFSQIITDACNGEDIIITRNNIPAVRLTLVVPPVTKKIQCGKHLLKNEKK